MEGAKLPAAGGDGNRDRGNGRAAGVAAGLSEAGGATTAASRPRIVSSEPSPALAQPAGLAMPGGSRRIALLLPTLAGGGAEACTLRTAAALLDRGFRVDLVVCERTGPLWASVPPGVRLIELPPAPLPLARALALAADPAGLRQMLAPVLLAWRPPRHLPHLPGLVCYLRAQRPDALFAAMPTPNLLAVWARRLAGVPTRVLVSERNTLSAMLGGSRRWRDRHLPRLLGHAYRQADGIVAVSDGVADDLARQSGLPRARIATVYNPVITPETATLAGQPVAHRWFLPGSPPVILGVGSLSARKDFPTLLRAFARLRATRDCRLVIFGQAATARKTEEQQAALMALAAELGVAADVDLPGFVTNPFAYMARAAVFVLSSTFEGLPGVLIQAIACGCPAVSTDCPSGPAEILAGGRFGALVPVGDDRAMAAAMAATLDHPVAAATLRARAAMFDVDRAVDRYVDLLFDQGEAGLGAQAASGRKRSG
jgi:glycosyltransferase involved in cell wall biosynthesis